MNQLGFLRGLMSDRRNVEKEFISMILEDRIPEAVELARMFVSKDPTPLVVSCLVSLLRNQRNSDKEEFLESLKAIKVKSSLVWMLCKRGLLIEELHGYVEKTGVKDYLYYLTLKEIYIHNHHRVLKNGDVLEHAEFLLDNLDDWDIYQYALDNNLRLKDRGTLNYRYYLLHRYKDKGAAIELLRSRLCFKEIKYIVDLVGLQGHPDEAIDCVVQLTCHGFSEGLLERSYRVYKREASLLSTKTLIATLVSSKKIEHLVLALYLSFKHRDIDPSNYEIALVFMFLCRYFCFYPYVLKLFGEMSIKNAQIPNLSFIWSDVMIVRSIGDEDRRRGFLEDMRRLVQDLENGVRYLIAVGNIPHVVDILELRRSIVNSVIAREVSERRIIGTNPMNSFSLLLGNHCSYLFEKMTVDKIPKDRAELLTDHYVQARLHDGVLENGLCDVKDENFLCFFRDLVEYQSVIG